MVNPMCLTVVRCHTQMSDSQESKMYPAKMYKLFLQQNKGMKALIWRNILLTRSCLISQLDMLLNAEQRQISPRDFQIKETND